jgi:hypothetical protein
VIRLRATPTASEPEHPSHARRAAELARTEAIAEQAAHPAAGRRRAARRDRRRVRRTVRRLVGVADVRRVATGGGERQGRALRRGRRRALRRLPHLCGGPARPAGRAGCRADPPGRAAAEVVAARQPGIPRQALHARRATGAPRAPPRLEGDLLGGGTRGPARAARRAPDADPLAGWRARYAETAGAEPLARLQDVDLGT